MKPEPLRIEEELQWIAWPCVGAQFIAPIYRETAKRINPVKNNYC